MTPDLSCLLLGGRARVVQRDSRWDMETKTDTIREQLFRQVARTSNYSSSTQWRYSDLMSPCDKPKPALIALICCGQCMAVSMPGHDDLTALMSPMTLSLTLWTPTV